MRSDKQVDRIAASTRVRTYRGPRFQPLRRAVKLPVWGDLGIRLGAALFLIFIVIMVHWWDREGLVDNLDGEVSFLDVVYFTMISITTTGFGDIAPISDRARLVEAVIVTPIRFAVFFIFVGTAYNFIIKRSWEKWRMARIQEQLSDHIVVLGYGISGSEAVGELIERGTDPSCIVVIDNPKSYRIYGSDVAAPVFKDIADKIYAIDMELNDPFVGQKIAEGVFPVIQSGEYEDLSQICNTMGISNHLDESADYVKARIANNSITWKKKDALKNTVPDVRGMTLRDALFLLENKNYEVSFSGVGRVLKQSLAPGTKAQRQGDIKLTLG